ncbi:MAG: class I SAM-dependent methyltransferase [Burkholderiales bacterium]
MKDFWNERYAAEHYFYGTEPNAFLAAQAHRLQPGQSALAVADGEGRNGVWLAQQGLDVLSVDFSAPALEKSRRLAERCGVSLRTELADLQEWDWKEHHFDVVVAIFVQIFGSVQRPAFHRNMVKALKPGGLLILQAYTPKQLEYKTGGPSNLDNLYGAEILAADFADLDILHLQEREHEISEGVGHCGMSAVVELVARKRG